MEKQDFQQGTSSLLWTVVPMLMGYCSAGQSAEAQVTYQPLRCPFGSLHLQPTQFFFWPASGQGTCPGDDAVPSEGKSEDSTPAIQGGIEIQSSFMQEDELGNPEGLLALDFTMQSRICQPRKYTMKEFFRPQALLAELHKKPCSCQQVKCCSCCSGSTDGFPSIPTVLPPFLTVTLAAPIRHLNWCVSAVCAQNQCSQESGRVLRRQP